MPTPKVEATYCIDFKTGKAGIVSISARHDLGDEIDVDDLKKEMTTLAEQLKETWNELREKGYVRGSSEDSDEEDDSDNDSDDDDDKDDDKDDEDEDEDEDEDSDDDEDEDDEEDDSDEDSDDDDGDDDSDDDDDEDDDEDDDDDDDDEEEGKDYDTMDEDELRAECKKRGIKKTPKNKSLKKAKKGQLIDALETHDNEQKD